MKEKVLSFHFLNWAKNNKRQLLLLIVLCLVTYANSLPNEFVSDDTRAFLESRKLSDFNSVLAQPLQFFQPLEYFIILSLFGPNPAILRSVTVIFHVATVLSGYLLVWILSKKSTAFVAAALFAVHPILVESVAWISGGIHVRYAFLLMVSLIAHVFAAVSGKNIYWFLSVLFAFLAFSASEKAMVIPFLLLLFQIVYRIRISWKHFLPFLVLIFIYGTVMFYGYGVRTSAYEFQHVKERALDNPLVQVPVTLTSYFELIFFPKDLTLYHTELVFTYREFAFRAAVTVVYFILIVIYYFLNPFVSFFLAFFTVSLLPTLTPLGISWYVAERYAYLATFGIIATTAFSFTWLYERIKVKYLSYLLFIILTLLLMVRTMIRNADWKNGDRLYLAAAKTSPSSPQNHNNLGDYYARQKQFDRAVAEFELAIKLLPRYADAYHNLATTYVQLGKIQEAVANFEKALELNPSLWQTHAALALVYYNQNQYEAALSHLDKAISLNQANASLVAAREQVRSILAGKGQ
jgi:hypothetical protein